jgi:phosphoribosylamine--glycine ligase
VWVDAAGVAAGADGGLVTAGGRVLGVGATGPDLASARRRAYDGVAAISWAGMTFRPDIAAAAAGGGTIAGAPAGGGTMEGQ